MFKKVFVTKNANWIILKCCDILQTTKGGDMKAVGIGEPNIPKSPSSSQEISTSEGLWDCLGRRGTSRR